jgi:hypothetical protein
MSPQRETWCVSGTRSPKGGASRRQNLQLTARWPLTQRRGPVMIYSVTRRSCLPSLRPSISRRDVAGAFFRPCCTSLCMMRQPFRDAEVKFVHAQA